MGQFINGKWKGSDNLANETGAFVRQPTSFRKRIASDSEFLPESNRYHLYVSAACPWAHRTLIVRKLQNLENHISLSIVDPYMGENGWHFSDCNGCIPDHVNDCETLGQVYLKADPQFTGKVTVPVLWDKKTGMIVNNESLDIIKIFSEDLRSLSGTFSAGLYPEGQKEQIDKMIESNYEPINNGVYKAGFATKQQVYEEAVAALFRRLDEIEVILNESAFLCGKSLSLADICLYTTLVRFDLVYHYHFKCNVKKIASYPAVTRFLKHLHFDLKFNTTCDFDHIKEHYYTSHKSINPFGIIPVGPAFYI